MPTLTPKRDKLLQRALLGIALIALAIRMLAVAEPLGIDQGLWASAVRGMAHGQRLYRDVWEQRPPGIYFTYLAGFSVFGWTTSVVTILDVLASAVTAAALFVLGRSLAGRTTGALAAALYAALTMPAWLYRNGGFLERSVCETFIVICVALAACCLVRPPGRLSVARALGFGLCAGAAVVYKPNAGLYFPLLLIWGLTLDGPGTRRWLPSVVQPIAIALAGATVAPVVTLIWLWHLGLLADARTAVIDFNRFYVSAGFEPATYALAFSKAVWLRMKTDPLWLAGGVASVMALWDLIRVRRLASLQALAVVWGTGAVLVIAVNGVRLFNSYFVQALAPLSLLVAWWFTSASAGSWIRRTAVVLTMVLMCVLLIERSYVSKVTGMARDDARVLFGWTDRATYLGRFGGYGTGGGYSARANDELATYLRTHTQPTEQVFLFSVNGAGVYFLADRLTAHRFLRVNFFVPTSFPDPAFTLGTVVEALRVRKPRYVVFETLHSESPVGTAVDALQQDPLVTSLLEAYVQEPAIEDFTPYRLRDVPSGTVSGLR